MTFAKSGRTYSRAVHRASCELLTPDNTFQIVVHSNGEYVRCPFLKKKTKTKNRKK